MADENEAQKLEAAWDDLDRAWRELEDDAYGVAADFAESAARTLRELAAVLATRRAVERKAAD